jgi:hypothetical protein
LFLNYTIRKVQQNEEDFESNKTHQLLVYADDVKILDKNIHNTKINTETLLEARYRSKRR